MKYLSLLLGGALLSLNVVADEVKEVPVTEAYRVKIIWQDADNYRDVKAVGDIQSRYEQRTFETLTKNLNKDAKKTLKPNQKLEMVVTDVDLAGDVRPTFGATPNDIRVIKDIYPPRITFSYKVLEGEQVIVAGDEKLRDMSFMHSTGIRSDKPLSYESKMLGDWLKNKVAPQL